MLEFEAIEQYLVSLKPAFRMEDGRTVPATFKIYLDRSGDTLNVPVRFT